MRLFIVDRDPLFRTLVRLLVARDCAAIACRTDDGPDAYVKVMDFKPHLLIVADELNTCSGLHLLNRLRGQMDPGTVTVLLASVEEFSFPSSTAYHVDRIIYRHDLFLMLPQLIRCVVNKLPLKSR